MHSHARPCTVMHGHARSAYTAMHSHAQSCTVMHSQPTGPCTVMHGHAQSAYRAMHSHARSCTVSLQGQPMRLYMVIRGHTRLYKVMLRHARSAHTVSPYGYTWSNTVKNCHTQSAHTACAPLRSTAPALPTNQAREVKGVLAAPAHKTCPLPGKPALSLSRSRPAQSPRTTLALRAKARCTKCLCPSTCPFVWSLCLHVVCQGLPQTPTCRCSMAAQKCAWRCAEEAFGHTRGNSTSAGKQTTRLVKQSAMSCRSMPHLRRSACTAAGCASRT